MLAHSHEDALNRRELHGARTDIQALRSLYAQSRGPRTPVFVWTPPELSIPAGFDLAAASDRVVQVSDQGLASSPISDWSDWGLASETPTSIPCRFADDDLDVEQFAARLYATRGLTLQMVRS